MFRQLSLLFSSVCTILSILFFFLFIFSSVDQGQLCEIRRYPTWMILLFAMRLGWFCCSFGNYHVYVQTALRTLLTTPYLLIALRTLLTTPYCVVLPVVVWRCTFTVWDRGLLLRKYPQHACVVCCTSFGVILPNRKWFQIHLSQTRPPPPGQAAVFHPTKQGCKEVAQRILTITTQQLWMR